MKKKPPKKAPRRAAPSRERAARHPLFAATPGIDDRLVAAYEHALATYGHRPNVTGIDIGLQRTGGEETGKLAVRIHVREKVASKHVRAGELLPPRLGGVDVDVIQRHYVQHAGAGAKRFATLQPGISIGHPRLQGGSGTLGLFVRDDQGRPGLLSASHVIVPDGSSQPGDPILQAGRGDSGQAPADTVATVSRFDLRTDSAVAVLNGARPWIAEQLTSNVTLVGSRVPAIGDVLTKSGRSTDVTTARVDGVAGPYGGVQASFHMVPVTNDGTLICDFGDSGAVWYDAATLEAVGLHCRGAEHPTGANQFAIASAVTVVLSRLQVTM
jgi:hypothetical protein